MSSLWIIPFVNALESKGGQNPPLTPESPGPSPSQSSGIDKDNPLLLCSCCRPIVESLRGSLERTERALIERTAELERWKRDYIRLQADTATAVRLAREESAKR